jgi:hypothetical protein
MVVLLIGIAARKHRGSGVETESLTYRSEAARAGDSDAENRSETSDNISMAHILRNRNTANNVNIDLRDGDRVAPDDGNMNPIHGNRSMSDNSNPSQGRASVHYVPGHPYHPLRMNPVVNASQDQASVHYVPGHPYHPLRMNPVDSMDTIRPVAPDMTEGKVETIEQAEQDPNNSKSPVILVSTIPSLYTTGETIENGEEVPIITKSTPPPVSDPLPPAGCDCENS